MLIAEAGCSVSHGTNPVENQDSTQEQSLNVGAENESNRNIIAMYEAQIYERSQTWTIDLSGLGGSIEYFSNNSLIIIPLTINRECNQVWIDNYDNYLYMAAGFSGLKIFDVSNKMHPVHIKTIPMTDAVTLAFQNNFIFVVDIGKGLRIVNVSYPPRAYISKTVRLTQTPLSVCVVEKYAYVANNPNGLETTDINLIKSAYFVKTVNTAGYPNNVDVEDEYVYLSDGANGLVLFMLSRLAQHRQYKMFRSISKEPYSLKIITLTFHA